ncbi:MgtC/SapB family protein [Massilia sp. CT11-108]|uniref:MgtC/SapB family protein n=1 Tax=Massilia sp. CT11-108 TaxID=3393900 RepID=UPI0039A48CC5
MDYLDILLRLTVSVLVGGMIGLDRNLHGKPTGIRTLGLVCLGACVWITAILGILCGMGSWQIAAIALVLVFVLFVCGKPIERALHRRWLDKPEQEKQAIRLHEE